MKATELKKAINERGVIITTAEEFLNSSVTWYEDNICPEDYMVEILKPDHDDKIIVTFVRNEEFVNRVYNTDFSETISYEDEADFINELCENSQIFELR